MLLKLGILSQFVSYYLLNRKEFQLINRWPRMRAERARLKSCKDDAIIAQGKRGMSAALGKRHKMIPSLFSNLVWRARTRQTRLEKREVGLRWRFTQGGGLGGLALGYYLAAPHGAPEAT